MTSPGDYNYPPGEWSVGRLAIERRLCRSERRLAVCLWTSQARCSRVRCTVVLLLSTVPRCGFRHGAQLLPVFRDARAYCRGDKMTPAGVAQWPARSWGHFDVWKKKKKPCSLPLLHDLPPPPPPPHHNHHYHLPDPSNLHTPSLLSTAGNGKVLSI